MSTSKYNFTGKVALVTGSSSGIGEAIALQLAQYGAKLVITGRNAQKLESVAAKIEQISGGSKPLKVIGDLQDDATLSAKLINETVAQFGGLDILVNNAGAATPKGTYDSANLMQEFDDNFNLNVKSVIALTQQAVPHLEKTKGNIVNISSAGSLKPYLLIYCSTKAALDMVTKTSALELGPMGIRVNSVNPGYIATNFLATMGMDQKEVQDAYYKQIAESSLMKRIGTTEDIANLVSFLASDDARNITGSIYVSDSGALLQ